jgi:outer membrane protein assembly factor BamB
LGTGSIFASDYIANFFISDGSLLMICNEKKKYLPARFTAKLKALDLSTGKLIWEKEIGKHVDFSRAFLKSPHLYFKAVLPRQVILTEEHFWAPEHNRVTVINIDPLQNEWTAEGLFLINNPDCIKDSILLWRPDMPDYVFEYSLIDGEEAGKIKLMGINQFAGVLVKDNTLVCMTNISERKKKFSEHFSHWGKHDTLIYSQYGPDYEMLIGYDLEEREENWRLELGKAHLRPFLRGDVLYFGDLYEGDFIEPVLFKKEILSDIAFALDVRTGEVLWEVRLEGDNHSRIARLVVKDKMAFIKSLNGWIYAIGWDEQ